MKGETPRRDPLFSMRLLVGLWIIALGAIFLAGNLGWIDTRQAFRLFWPLIFVLVGSSMVMQKTNKRSNRWGWVFIGVGVIAARSTPSRQRTLISAILVPSGIAPFANDAMPQVVQKR